MANAAARGVERRFGVSCVAGAAAVAPFPGLNGIEIARPA
jgi:hypothetical protein